MGTLPVLYSGSLSEYERAALREIHQWKQPKKRGWLGRTVGQLNRGLHNVTDLVRKVPGVEWTIENVFSGLLNLTNEIMHDSVWRDAILKEYRAAGHEVEDLDSVSRLNLEEIDAVVKGLDSKYRALAATQGAAAGYAGAAGIVPDVVGLVALNLRAAGEYATYLGYDVAQPSERLYALQILNMVSQPLDTSIEEQEDDAMVPVGDVSLSIARQQTVQTLESVAASGALRGITRALGTRLTKAKLAQVMPMAGAFVGGGFNVYYTAKVCDAAFYLYRERWLLEKYGLDAVNGAS